MSAIKNYKNFVQVHYGHMDEKLNSIKSLALSMGECVEKTIADAKDIILGKVSPEDRLPTMKTREEKVNSLHLKLAKECFKSLAQAAPVAKDLRLILALLNANTDLERMGDLAISIARKAKRMETHPTLKPTYTLLEKMFDTTIDMVHISLNSFIKEDESLAKKVLKMDDLVDSLQIDIIKESESIMRKNPDLIPTCTRLITISGSIERIADHSTNLSEELIFLQTGHDIRHGRREL